MICCPALMLLNFFTFVCLKSEQESIKKEGRVEAVSMLNGILDDVDSALSEFQL